MSLPAGYGATGKASGLSGTGYKQVSMPTLSPEQQQLFQQLLGGSGGGVQAGLSQLSQLAGGGSEDYWNQLEAPALRQFRGLQQQTASQFSGLGSGGSRKSSGFQNAMGGAHADLAERLQGQRLSLQRDAISQLLGLSSDLLHTPLQQNYLIPKQKPFWQELLAGLGPAAGLFGGSFGSQAALMKLFPSAFGMDQQQGQQQGVIS